MAQTLGISGQRYGPYERERTIPDDVLAALSTSTNVDIAWLLTGTGAMFRNGDPLRVAEEPQEYGPQSAAERVRHHLDSAIELLPGMAAHEAPAIVVRELKGGEDAGIKDALRECVAVPILGGAIAAGPPRNVFEQEIEDWAICYRSVIRHPDQTSCVRVAGDSMEPYIPDGSLVGIDHTERDPAALDRRIVAVRQEDDCVIRTMQILGDQILLSPANESEENRPLVICLKEATENPIIGRVVFVHAMF